MNAPIQNSKSQFETLKARKAHLTSLLSIVEAKSGKATETQKLTIKGIKAEINHINVKLKPNT
ncbi:hypothetical protein J3D47_005207 [Pseudomonas laurylsulfativorans]|uniref:hypothetical protein n=1 Tax=Pseudomonas laurylsulfativorans TaxID=1943631 RepID=UPI00209DA3BF|nr:hypothetical protein [Pseudomonas laurylsulfativorans]MCP1420964.1 hypothetical protein [Pseudomonas laurylsulfativorans]